MSEVTGGVSHPIVVEPTRSAFWELPPGVALVEPKEGSPGITHPGGFAASGIAAGLKDSGSADVGVVCILPEWRPLAASAAVFTTNAFAAAPVVVDRSECDLSHLVAVGINSGNANACTGETGLAVARDMQKACAAALGASHRQVAVASTGVIGVQLDSVSVCSGVTTAARAVCPDGGAAFCRSIMTTDRFPKMCAVSVDTVDGPVRIGGCAKGAGMISPALATMLCVVTTDAVVSPEDAAALLRKSTEKSFNLVTVDGEMSTNDSVFLMASGASGVRLGPQGLARLGAALDSVLLRLALMMVADGEGATKVMRLRVEGAEDTVQATSVARAIADSPLVKTAMHGSDPNWGRIISSAGAAMAGRSLPQARLVLCGVTAVAGGTAVACTPAELEQLRKGMQTPEIDIGLDLALGGEVAETFFADLGHEYVSINAEYHT